MQDASAPIRIPKQTIGAVLRTQDQLIVGRIHVDPQKRLKDEMNIVSHRFIAVTDAKVYDAEGTHLVHEASFMLVSNAHIVTVTPLSGIAEDCAAPWYTPPGQD